MNAPTPLRPASRPVRKGLAALAIVLLSFVLRAYALDGQSLWSDESISLERSSLPLPEMLAEMPVEHAPLYFVLLNGWLRVAGGSDFSLRYPSLWFGVLSVALLFALGRKLFGPRSASVAALLLAASPIHVWYSQEARMYAMATAFGLAALLAVTRAIARDEGRCWAAFAVLSALGLYTHYYVAIVLAVAAGTVVAARLIASRTAGRSVPGPGRFLAAEIGAVALFAPWLPRSLGVLSFPGWRPPAALGDVAVVFLVRLLVGPSSTARSELVVALTVLAVAALGAVAAVRSAGRHTCVTGASLVLVGMGLPVLGLVAIMAWKADVHERYFLAATPPWYLAMALGIERLGRVSSVRSDRRLRRAIPAVALSWLLVVSVRSLVRHYCDPTLAKPDYRDYAAHIAGAARPNDALVLLGPGHFLTERYGGGDLPRIYNLLSTSNRGKSDVEIASLLSAIAQRHDRVWLAVQGREPGYVKEWFDRHGYFLSGGWRSGLLVYLYGLPAHAPAFGARPATQNLTGALSATLRYAFGPRLVSPGDAVFVDLDLTPVGAGGGWSAAPHVSLRLVAADGSVEAALDTDEWLAGARATPTEQHAGGDSLSARLGILVPDVASGRYVLEAHLCDCRRSPAEVSARLGTVSIRPGGDG